MDCIKHLAKCSKSLNVHALYRSIEALSICATILKISCPSINQNLIRFFCLSHCRKEYIETHTKMTPNERLLVTLGLLSLFSAVAVSYDLFHDLPGPHCSKRSDPCCTQRQDDCGVPLAGKLNYSDPSFIRKAHPLHRLSRIHVLLR